MEITPINADTFRNDLLRHGQFIDWERSYENFPFLYETDEPERWDGHAKTNTTSQHPVTIQRIKQTVRMIQKHYRPQMRILDFGVGYGDVAKALAKTGLRFRYHGIDISRQFVTNLKQELGKDLRFSFAVENLFDIPHQSYDMILGLEVLEHISPPNLFSILGQFHLVLAPQGKLIVSVPLKEDLSVCTSFNNKTQRLENTNGHVRSYTTTLLRAELTKAGFTVDKMDLVRGGCSLKSQLYHRLITRHCFNAIAVSSL